MPEPLSHYLRLVALRPVDAMREIIALGLPERALWIAFWLLSILSAILVALQARVILTGADLATLPPGFVEMMTIVRDSPMTVAIGQAMLFFLLLQALDRVGRAMGGTGDFRGALQLIVLALSVSTALMVGQLLGMVLIPFLATLVGFAFLVFLFWHVPGLVMGLHGFQNRFAVFTMIVLGFVVIQLALSLVASILRVALT